MHAPHDASPLDWSKTHAAIWRSRRGTLRPVHRLARVALDSLLGVDDQKAALVRNTLRFLEGRPANNVLLWGSRGTGKSSLIKGLLNAFAPEGLRVIEVDKDDLVDLQEIVDQIYDQPYRYLIFCDDLSFDSGESGYKALKTVLEGSIELPPENVLIYATSNRRHLMPEYMEENQQTHVVKTELHHAESIEEKIALSDRFGLWLSFYPIDQPTYLDMIDQHFADWQGDREHLHRLAIRFALQRGGRSGRAAWQFYRQYTGVTELEP